MKLFQIATNSNQFTARSILFSLAAQTKKIPTVESSVRGPSPIERASISLGNVFARRSIDQSRSALLEDATVLSSVGSIERRRRRPGIRVVIIARDDDVSVSRSDMMNSRKKMCGSWIERGSGNSFEPRFRSRNMQCSHTFSLDIRASSCAISTASSSRRKVKIPVQFRTVVVLVVSLNTSKIWGA